MDWSDIIMEVIIASLVTGLLGIIAVIITNFFTDKKRHNEIDSKIGIVDNTTLSGQHGSIQNKISFEKEDLKRTVIDKTFNLEKTVTDKAGNLEKLCDRTLFKVSNIDKEIAISKNNYLSLDVDQKGIKNNIDKLLYEWQTLNSENKEIKKELEIIREQNNNLAQQNNDLIQQNENLQKSNEKLSDKWQVLAIENKDLQKELGIVREQNNTLVKQSDEILKENRELSKHVQLARRTLRNRNKEEEYDRALEDEDEDEWELEL